MNAFEENEIHLEQSEIDEMLEYMNKNEVDEDHNEDEENKKKQKFNDV